MISDPGVWSLRCEFAFFLIRKIRDQGTADLFSRGFVGRGVSDHEEEGITENPSVAGGQQVCRGAI